MFGSSSGSMAGMPLVSLGPSGIGGEYQREGGKYPQKAASEKEELDK